MRYLIQTLGIVVFGCSSSCVSVTRVYYDPTPAASFGQERVLVKPYRSESPYAEGELLLEDGSTLRVPDYLVQPTESRIAIRELRVKGFNTCAFVAGGAGAFAGGVVGAYLGIPSCLFDLEDNGCQSEIVGGAVVGGLLAATVMSVAFSGFCKSRIAADIEAQ